MQQPPTEARSRNMRAITRRDTRPEVTIRSLLHRRGMRFRVDFRIGSGRGAARPDIAFTRQRVAVFVDGCFWHGCPVHGTRPKTNADYWQPKLDRNRERDIENDRQLRAQGWEVVRVWEHDDPIDAAETIAHVVAERTARNSGIGQSAGA